MSDQLFCGYRNRFFAAWCDLQKNNMYWRIVEVPFKNVKEVDIIQLLFSNFYSPKMYIIVKQLSKANPTRNRHKLNCQKLPTKAVAIPATNPIELQPAKAGIRPYRSAIHPNNNPPQIAPKKKIDWDNVGKKSFSHTQSSSVAIVLYGISVKLYSQPCLQAWMGHDLLALTIPSANISVKLTAYIEHLSYLNSDVDPTASGIANSNLQ